MGYDAPLCPCTHLKSNQSNQISNLFAQNTSHFNAASGKGSGVLGGGYTPYTNFRVFLDSVYSPQ